MAIIYTNSRYKPKRKSRRLVEVAPKFQPEFRELRFSMPAAYRPNTIPSLKLESMGAIAGRAEPKKYTGGRTLVGIGVLHKSCLQPIFSEAEAVEIAQMRR